MLYADRKSNARILADVAQMITVWTMKRSLVPEVSRHNSPHAKFRWALSPFRRLENDWPPTKTFIDMHVEIHHLDFTEMEAYLSRLLQERLEDS